MGTEQRSTTGQPDFFRALSDDDMQRLALLAIAANARITVRPVEGTPDGKMAILYEYIFEPARRTP